MTRGRHGTVRTALGLSLAFVPFVLAQHVQEDAYITFRCARTLADTGVYGFNPGETVSASTSHLAVFVAALARLVAGDRFIWLVQAIYVVCGVEAARRIARLLFADARWGRSAWPAIALLPSMLVVGYSGMETALLLLVVTVLIEALVSDAPRGASACAAAALLPWVRPDAAALGMLVILTLLVRRDRTPGDLFPACVGLLAGAIGWLAFNRLVFGGVLTQTILAKALVWSPRSPQEAWSLGLSQLRTLWVGDGSDPAMFLPVRTRYLAGFGPAATAIVLLATVFLWRRPHAAVSRRGLALFTVLAFLLPLPYALAGRVYPWYVWPSAVAGQTLAVAALLVAADGAPRWLRSRTGLVGGLLMAVLAAAQLAYAVSWGTQERLYRGRIGETIARMASPGDTLLLEPAGYIPFFAGIRTWDEVGLATPTVTTYRRRFGQAWWPRFVAEQRPTWILAREPFQAHLTLDGYRLTPEEQASFAEHYALVATFSYRPEDLREAAVLRAIARRGRAGAYLLYGRR